MWGGGGGVEGKEYTTSYAQAGRYVEWGIAAITVTEE